MRTLALSIRTGWRFLFHPVETLKELDQAPDAFRRAIAFVLFAEGLWMLLTLTVNVFFKSTSRGREHFLGIYLGPDVILSLLTVPLAFAILALASRLCSWTARLFGGKGDWKATFIVLSFTLNAGSLFFDFPNEVGFSLVFRGFAIFDLVPAFVYWALFVMFMPVAWSFTVTVIALARRFEISLGKALLAFLLGVLPMFTVLLFFMA